MTQITISILHYNRIKHKQLLKSVVFSFLLRKVCGSIGFSRVKPTNLKHFERIPKLGYI